MPTCRTDSPCAWLVGAYVVATLVTPVQAQDDGTGTVHLDSGNTGKTVFAIVTLLSMFYLGTVLGESLPHRELLSFSSSILQALDAENLPGKASRR